MGQSIFSQWIAATAPHEQLNNKRDHVSLVLLIQFKQKRKQKKKKLLHPLLMEN